MPRLRETSKPMLTINQEKNIRRQKQLAAPSRQMLLEELAKMIRQFRVLSKDVSSAGQAERRKIIPAIDAALDELKIP